MKPVDQADAIVLRIGELFLKGKNRYLFERCLASNVERTLRPLGQYDVALAYGRLFVRGAVTTEAVTRLSRTFGVASLSRAVLCPPDIDCISEIASELGRQRAAQGAQSFAVATRRPNKSFPLKSAEVNVRVGKRIQDETAMRVDLDRPDATIGIEIGHEGTFVYGDKLAGAGGLPVGASGTAMLLLSGGIDSPVAGYLAQKRGLRLGAAYFHAFPYTGDAARDKVIDLARMLAKLQGGIRLWVVPFASVQEALRDGAPGKLLVLLYRRMMVRIGEALARRHGFEALVTGDSLGQVASQTLTNLACVERVVTLPLLRPLVAFDKVETINLARQIGTFDKSTEPYEDCCSLFVPSSPETKGDDERLCRIEERFPIGEWIEKAVRDAQTFTMDVEGKDFQRRAGLKAMG